MSGNILFDGMFSEEQHYEGVNYSKLGLRLIIGGFVAQFIVEIQNISLQPSPKKIKPPINIGGFRL